MRRCLFLSCALLTAVCFKTLAQDVVSASSGVLEYFEGSVVIDDKPVGHQTAIFPSLKKGSVLQTNKGRAEILLTPGVYLRLDEASGIRMVSNSLTDTRVALTRGTAIIDNVSATSSDPVTLAVDGSSITFPKPGVYRIDSDLGELQTYSGDAKVTHRGNVTMVDSDHHYNLTVEMLMEKIGADDTDEFYDWARSRNEQIADKNQMASADQIDSQDPDPAAGLFAVPPTVASPGLNMPSGNSSTLASGTYAPLYVYQSPQYFPPYTGFLGMTVIGYRPGVYRWPTGTTARPRPVVLRWPSTSMTLTHHPITPVHLPALSSPAYAHPTSNATVTGSHFAAPHTVVTPHVSVGHR